MEGYPRDLVEFEARFATEEACRDYLFRLRWPDGFRCPRCGHERAWPLRKVWLQCARCGRQSSVTAGTIFQDTRKPPRLWFRAIWQVTWQKNGASTTSRVYASSSGLVGRPLYGWLGTRPPRLISARFQRAFLHPVFVRQVLKLSTTYRACELSGTTNDVRPGLVNGANVTP